MMAVRGPRGVPSAQLMEPPSSQRGGPPAHGGSELGSGAEPSRQTGATPPAQLHSDTSEVRTEEGRHRPITTHLASTLSL